MYNYNINIYIKYHIFINIYKIIRLYKHLGILYIRVHIYIYIYIYMLSPENGE